MASWKGNRNPDNSTILTKPKWNCWAVQSHNSQTCTGNADCQKSPSFPMGWSGSSCSLSLKSSTIKGTKWHDTGRGMDREETRCITPAGIWMFSMDQGRGKYRQTLTSGTENGVCWIQRWPEGHTILQCDKTINKSVKELCILRRKWTQSQYNDWGGEE